MQCIACVVNTDIDLLFESHSQYVKKTLNTIYMKHKLYKNTESSGFPLVVVRYVCGRV